MDDQQIRQTGERVFELFGACAAAPDDKEAGRIADEALALLERLLTERARQG